MDRPATIRRRSLDLRDADAIIAEIRRLQDGGYAMLGKWNLSQMCEHIAATLRMGLDGGDRRLPWVLRTMIVRPIWLHVIRTRRMMSGVPAPRGLVPSSPSGPDDPAAIVACISIMERARDADGPLPPHPMVDMTVDQWKQVNWIHASHHLSFLIPENEQSDAVAPGSASGQTA